MADAVLKRPGRALAFANYGHFLNHVVMLIFPTVALTLSDIWTIPRGEMLAAFFLGSLVYGVAAYPAGWLGDRWSSWGMLGVYLIGTGIVTFLTGFAQDREQMILGLAAIGLFASIYHPVGTAFVIQHATDRAKDLGRNGAWGTAGLASAAFIAAGISQIFGWRAAFFVPGAACFLLGIGFLLFTERKESANRPDNAIASDVTPTRANILRVLPILTTTTLAVGLITQAFTTGLPNLFDGTLSNLVEALSLDTAKGRTLTAAFVSIVVLFGAFGQIVGGNLASRFSPKNVYIGMFVLILPLATLSTQLSGVALVIVGAIMMIAITGCLPAENCIVANFCPQEWRGRVFSLKFVIALGGGSAALLANGYIFDQTQGFAWFFLFLAGLSLTIILAAIFLPPVAPPASVKEAAPVPAAAE